MWRASLLALALAALPARAEREERESPPDARSSLSEQLADELASIDRALAQVDDKLGQADAARGRRIAAAYRLLNAPLGKPAGDPGARMAAARRRAAARLLLDRDLAERRLLADEAAQLRTAAATTRATAVRVPSIELPTELGRPARGEIVRRFGTIVHERSKATLSRRGIDLEVDEHANAVAPADGVVRYAGPIRGLDAGVIVDHGTYLTVIAKLGTLSVPVGAPVKRGDRVGRAARRRVYLELRVKLGAGGLPIDPEPLMYKNRTVEPAPSDRSDRPHRSRAHRADGADRSTGKPR